VSVIEIDKMSKLKRSDHEEKEQEQEGEEEESNKAQIYSPFPRCTSLRAKLTFWNRNLEFKF
jgi:hypothetical protein